MRHDGSQAFFGNTGLATLEINLDEPHTPWVIHLHARLDEFGYIFIDHCTIQQKKGLAPGEERSISLKCIPEELIRRQLEVALGSPWSERVAQAAQASEEDALPSQGHKLPPKHYMRVAIIWMKAERDGNRSPYTAVMRRWDVTKQTAWRWKKEAVKLGFLPSDDKRKELLRHGDAQTRVWDEYDTAEFLKAQIFWEQVRAFALKYPQSAAVDLLSEIQGAEGVDRGMYRPSVAFVDMLKDFSSKGEKDRFAKLAKELLDTIHEAGLMNYSSSYRDISSFMRELNHLSNSIDVGVKQRVDMMMKILARAWIKQGHHSNDAE